MHNMEKCREEWKIRLEDEDFDKWRRSIDIHTMFFDGALKGNPGKAEGIGIIRCPLDQIISHFSWGLGLT